MNLYPEEPSSVSFANELSEAKALLGMVNTEIAKLQYSRSQDKRAGREPDEDNLAKLNNYLVQQPMLKGRVESLQLKYQNSLDQLIISELKNTYPEVFNKVKATAVGLFNKLNQEQ